MAKQMRTILKTIRAMWPRSIPLADYEFALQLIDRLRANAPPVRQLFTSALDPSPVRAEPAAPPPAKRRKSKPQQRRDAEGEVAKLVLLALEDEAGDVTIKHLAKATGYSVPAVARALRALEKLNKVSRRKMPKSKSPNPPFGYTRVKPGQA